MTAKLCSTLCVVAMAVSCRLFSRRSFLLCLIFAVTVIHICVFVAAMVILGNQSAKLVATVFNSTLKIVAMEMELGWFRLRTITFVGVGMFVSAVATVRENIP